MKKREFLTGALRTDERSRERGTMFKDRADMSEDSRAGHLQQPCSFQNNNQAAPTMSHRYTPQTNQLPENDFSGPDGHNNNGYNNNLYNGFPSFPPDWMQHQALIKQNTLSLPKISIDNFSGDPLKWHHWFNFFKLSLHTWIN